MALTASKSAGSAARISTVVPSASSAYTLPADCAVFMPVFPLLVAGSELQAGERRLGGRVGELVVDGHDALHAPDLLHDSVAEVRRLRGSRDLDHAVGHLHHEHGPVVPELLQHHLVHLLFA